VEQGRFRSEKISDIVEQALVGIKDNNIDTLILGCTHYPFLVEPIGQTMGPGVKLISSADETAREISTILYDKGKLSIGDEIPIHQFFCSGDAEMFQKIARDWLGEQIRRTPVVWQVSTL